jgi:2-polyprenyl-6-hydroxyphenyl methylase/3-demethylubiquinone-9 3-methyltransferase
MTNDDSTRVNADSAELAKFDAMAQGWWDPEGHARPLHDLNPVRLDYIESRAGLAGREVLDVGCGGGLASEGMARRGARVTAIDLADGAVTVARLHALEAGAEVDYQLRSAESLAEERPASFDVVTCLEMIEHVPEPARLMGALARLVRPGGHVIVSTLNRTPTAFALAIVGAEYLLRLLPAGTHEYARFIRPSELARWARAEGLELGDLTGLSYDPFARRARLTADTSVNYLAHFVRPARAAG